ncbi:acetyltransferase [Pseudoxanthomonas mexicana]|uniref:acetyltransferase n=1 Tax=Pseudoxanthomonas mexicana TaxID=128785 RepID=UPI0024E1D18A|nr:acetyltransferase [Pseudoxanthomonas mexicana]
MRIFGVVGAGGFGREVMPLLREVVLNDFGSSKDELCFVVEGEVEEGSINGHAVFSMERFLSFEGERYFCVAIGSSEPRERITSVMQERGAVPLDVKSGASIVMDGNVIGEGVVLCPFTTITSNARIGRGFQANIYSYVAHDCMIGDFVTFAPGVKCNGNVVIEDHAYIGTGAVLKQGSASKPLVIGKGAIVGMGAVVTKDVPPGVTVVGNPARAMDR